MNVGGDRRGEMPFESSRDALFQPCRIGCLELANRFVRSATWDPAMVFARRVDLRTVQTYQALAAGGAGLPTTGHGSYSYDDVRIRGFRRLVAAIHGAEPTCRVIAQIGVDVPGAAPSGVPTPFDDRPPRTLSLREVRALTQRLAVAVRGVRRDGFDGAQFHAAHGGLLSRFLSPYANARRDAYGGSPEGRARILRESVAAARDLVGDFPILVKMNGSDFVPGGLDLTSLPAQAAAVAAAGIDAIEISGGMWDCLVRGERELGFRPVPSPEARTHLTPDEESYFARYAHAAKGAVDVPIILTGGNRDLVRLATLVRGGIADLIGLSRPLVREPDLIARWRSGKGASSAACISCNGCLYDMYAALDRGTPGHVVCVAAQAPERWPAARAWFERIMGEIARARCRTQSRSR